MPFLLPLQFALDLALCPVLQPLSDLCGQALHALHALLCRPFLLELQQAFPRAEPAETLDPL